MRPVSLRTRAVACGPCRGGGGSGRASARASRTRGGGGRGRPRTALTGTTVPRRDSQLPGCRLGGGLLVGVRARPSRRRARPRPAAAGPRTRRATGRRATARAVTASYASRPSPATQLLHSSARPDRCGRSSRPAAPAPGARPLRTLRPALSIRSTCAAGSATASARPGKPAPEPMSAIRRAVAQLRHLEARQRSARCTSAASAGSRTVVGGSGSAASASQQRGELPAAPAGSPYRPRKLAERFT